MSTLQDVKFVRAVDGDTIIVTIPGVRAVLGRQLPVRLAGIQCEEIRANDPEKYRLAIMAKNFTQRICEKAEKITLFNVKRGKYFRLVADVAADDLLLNGELIKRKLAIKKKF